MMIRRHRLYSSLAVAVAVALAVACCQRLDTLSIQRRRIAADKFSRQSGALKGQTLAFVLRTCGPPSSINAESSSNTTASGAVQGERLVLKYVHDFGILPWQRDEVVVTVIFRLPHDGVEEAWSTETFR
jgi:hypothetical protein